MHLLKLFLHLYLVKNIALYDNVVIQGEHEYQNLITNSHSDCYSLIIEALNQTCHQLNENLHNDLALSLTNCYLLSAGMPPIECKNGLRGAQCVVNSTERYFTTFTEFYTVTYTICHYLEHKNWQKNTQKTIFFLKSSADYVTMKLNESKDLLNTLMDISSDQQKKIMENNEAIRNDIFIFNNLAQKIFQDFTSVTTGQKLIIDDIFDRIENLQTFVLSQFQTVFTVGFYVLGLLAVYLFTAAPQTTRCRFVLMIIMTLSFLFENMLYYYFIVDETKEALLLNSNGPVYTKIWLLRKFICFMCFVILFYSFWTFKEYALLNFQLLQKMENQNSQILDYIKELAERNAEERAPFLHNLDVFAAAEVIPAEERAAEVIPAEERAAEVIPAEERAAEVIPAEERDAEERDAEERDAEERAAEARPAEDLPSMPVQHQSKKKKLKEAHNKRNEEAGPSSSKDSVEKEQVSNRKPYSLRKRPHSPEEDMDD